MTSTQATVRGETSSAIALGGEPAPLYPVHFNRGLSPLLREYTMRELAEYDLTNGRI